MAPHDATTETIEFVKNVLYYFKNHIILFINNARKLSKTMRAARSEGKAI
jgi:hypothetical protein